MSLVESNLRVSSRRLLRLPTEVQTGFRLQQIVSIEQQNKIMNAAGTVKLAWQDLKLAFSPAECDCHMKEDTENNYYQSLTETGYDWPDFTFSNQRGNRWTLNRIVDVLPDGGVSHLERFSTNFQLSFEFDQYPFDVESFYIHVDMLYLQDRDVTVPMQGFSSIDPDHERTNLSPSKIENSITSIHTRKRVLSCNKRHYLSRS